MQLLVDDISRLLFDSKSASELVYDRKIETEYWDGYHNHHKIVKYDDAFQLPDAIAKPNPEFMEIIRCANSDPYQLHMANVEDKNDTFFTAEFVFLTTNDSNPTPVSLKNAEAFKRRITVDAEVTINPIYGRQSQQGGAHIVLDPLKLYQKQYPELNMDQIKDAIYKGEICLKPERDIYNFDVRFTNQIGDVLVEEMPYAKLLDIVLQSHETFKRNHSSKI
jgi:hypothetical protein